MSKRQQSNSQPTSGMPNVPTHIQEAIENARRGQSSNVSTKGSFIQERSRGGNQNNGNYGTRNSPPPPPEYRAPKAYPFEVIQYLTDLYVTDKDYVIVSSDIFIEDDTQDFRIYSQADLRKRKNAQVVIVAYHYQGSIYYRGSNEFNELTQLVQTGVEELRKAVSYYMNPPKQSTKPVKVQVNSAEIEEIVVELFNQYAPRTPAWVYMMAAAQFFVILIMFGFIIFG